MDIIAIVFLVGGFITNIKGLVITSICISAFMVVNALYNIGKSDSTIKKLRGSMGSDTAPMKNAKETFWKSNFNLFICGITMSVAIIKLVVMYQVV